MSSLAGSFLVARHALQDSNFRQTVILILRHNREGAFGLVVNRIAPVEGVPFPVHVGGPCESEGMFLLHGHADWIESSDDRFAREVAAGVFVGDSSCVNRVNDPPPGAALRYKMFTGYAGWGPQQLEGELAAGAWGVVPANGQLLFDTPVDDLWVRLVPPTIPQPSVN